MRVLYLLNQYPKLSHAFIRREIRALEALGWDVVRVSIRPSGEPHLEPADREEAARTRVVLSQGGAALVSALLGSLVAAPRRFAGALGAAVAAGIGSDRGLARHLAYLAEACLVLRWCREAGAAHVHAHFATNAAMVALLVHRLGGPPFSFTMHGPEEFDRPEALSLPRKLAEARFVVAISEYARGQLRRWCSPEDARRIHVVRCGLDRALLDAPARPVPERPRAVCVGRICRDKGQVLLVEAAALLAARGVAFEIALLGDGPERGEVERRARQLGVAERVRLLGAQGQAGVRREIEDSKLLVLPSYAEGLPMVIMEAFALHRPVVSTYVAAIPELVEPGRSGWLVPSGSAERLADALEEALASPPDALARMGDVGAARVAALHDAGAQARALADLFGGTAAGLARPGGTPQPRAAAEASPRKASRTSA